MKTERRRRETFRNCCWEAGRKCWRTVIGRSSSSGTHGYIDGRFSYSDGCRKTVGRFSKSTERCCGEAFGSRGSRGFPGGGAGRSVVLVGDGAEVAIITSLILHRHEPGVWQSHIVTATVICLGL